ncbi:MAG: hypothetical protein AB1567_03315 [bacterium]
MPKRPLLGEILVNEGAITKEQLQQALLDQKKSSKRLGRVLIDLELVPEEVVINYLSNQITTILEECEKSAPHLFKKPHELRRKRVLTHKKIPIRNVSYEKEIDRRLYAGHKRLEMARELFKQKAYDEVVSNVYNAMHHITRVVHYLQEHRGHLDTIRKVGLKTIYTGRSGTSQVERYSVFADKISEEINPFTKHQARTLIKDAEAYLRRVEEFLYQEKGMGR